LFHGERWLSCPATGNTMLQNNVTAAAANTWLRQSDFWPQQGLRRLISGSGAITE